MEKEDDLIFKLKSSIKRHPKLFTFLYNTLGFFAGKSAKRVIKNFPVGSVILNLGSGSKVIRDDVINVDKYSHPGVKVMADVYQLPFSDDYADAVVADFLLEHLKNPEVAVREMYRVLKPRGLVYITTPFMLGFHSSPDDYRRWTISGLRELMKDFEEKELGIYGGPTMAFVYFLREWLALVFSFGSNFLYQIWSLFFMVVLTPLNFLDFILARFKSAENVAYAYYYIGIKK